MTRPLKLEAYLNNTKNQFPASEKPIGISIKTTWQYRLFRKRNDLYSDNIIKNTNTGVWEKYRHFNVTGNGISLDLPVHNIRLIRH
jgi:hypothetical protein